MSYPKYYMSYSTANQPDSFREDFAHFYNLARFDPGVPKVHLYISISEIFPQKKVDMKRIKSLVQIAERNPKVNVCSTVFKSNIGRDFSSAATNVHLISKVACEEDYILFTNRSACGPLMNNWYSSYVKQYVKFSNVGLCGTTIRFSDHPERPCKGISTHVQSYVYLCRMLHLFDLIDNFPGRMAKTRLDAIAEGEIRLSQYFLNQNLSLTCLVWPEHKFNLKKINDSKLPQKDIKSIVRNVPFRYKFHRYLYQPHILIPFLLWYIKTAR